VGSCVLNLITHREQSHKRECTENRHRFMFKTGHGSTQLETESGGVRSVFLDLSPAVSRSSGNVPGGSVTLRRVVSAPERRDMEAIEYSHKFERLLFGMGRGLSRAGRLYLICGRLPEGQKHIHGKHRYSRKFADRRYGQNLPGRRPVVFICQDLTTHTECAAHIQ
jgi:hypothetical protein